MIKPPYEQALVGMGWNAGGPREPKEKKRKKRSRRCVSPGPEKRKKEKYPGDKCLLGLVLGSVVVVIVPLFGAVVCRLSPSFVVFAVLRCSSLVLCSWMWVVWYSMWPSLGLD
jgi:hypothetical protein